MSQKKYIQDVCRSKPRNTSDLYHARSMLYKKSYLIFQKLHQKAFPITINQAAEEYSNALREQIELEEKHYRKLVSSKEREMCLRLSAIWKLCQIVNFSDQKDDIKALMEWYNQTNTSLYFEYDRQAIFFQSQRTFEHPNFWPYAIRMTTLGYIDQLSALLRHVLPDVSLPHYSEILPYMMELNKIVLNLPLDTNKIRGAITKLSSHQWEHPNIKYHAEQIYVVMSILSGTEDITIQHTKDDIHAYICCRYYRSSVGSFAEFSSRNSPESQSYGSPSSSQNVLRCIIAGDINQAIEQCMEYDWWLLAHLTDLLTMKHMLDRNIQLRFDQDVISLPVKSHFMLYYASFLQNEFGLWKEAYIYMLECGDIGREAILEHLENMDLNVEDSVLLEIVEFCISHSLESAGIKLYKRKATVCMESNDYTNALYYYKMSKQDQYIDTVFNEIIWHLAMTGDWFDLSSLGLTTYDGIYYTIYQHLQSLYNHIASSELVKAANEFRTLVYNESVPEHIMPLIIWMGLALIKDSKTSLLTKDDILHVKSHWQKLNKYTTPQDFKLFYYYNKQDKSTIPTDPTELESILPYQQQGFLDITSVSFSRALERTLP